LPVLPARASWAAATAPPARPAPPFYLRHTRSLTTRRLGIITSPGFRGRVS
jgi:hypothetical protein